MSGSPIPNFLPDYNIKFVVHITSPNSRTPRVESQIGPSSGVLQGGGSPYINSLDSHQLILASSDTSFVSISPVVADLLLKTVDSFRPEQSHNTVEYRCVVLVESEWDLPTEDRRYVLILDA